MNYITPEDLQKFNNKYLDEEDISAQEYCDAGMDYVAKYLKYEPEGKEYTTKFRGDNGLTAPLEAMPIMEITSFKVDGESKNVDLLDIVKDNYIEFVDGSMFEKNRKYEITYKAGYFPVEVVHIIYSADGEHFYSDSAMQHEVEIPSGIVPESTGITENQYKYETIKHTVPPIIRLTTLQIASLFWESAGGNLAVSSTSFADTGSRVFNNFKADRFLEQITAYKRNF